MTVETGHVGLNVTDLERSKRFYQSLFGFELLTESKEAGRVFAFLGLEGKVVLTLWAQSDGTFLQNAPGLQHLSFKVDSIEELERAQVKLKELNVRVLHDGIVSHAEGADSGGIYFEDPDGIRLEIFTPSGVRSYAPAINDGPSCGFF